MSRFRKLVTSWACLGVLLFSSCARSQPAPPEADAAKYARLREAMPPRPEAEDRYAEWCTAKVYLRKVDFLLRYDSTNESWNTTAAAELEKAEEAIRRVTSEEPLALIRGQREEGYYADNDDSFQPFVRYVADSYKPDRKAPLLLYLHGYSPFYNLVNWQGVPGCLMAYAEAEGGLVAVPFGRSNTDYQGIGEQDVLRVIEEMQRRYNVDGERIFLTGHSMGGTGVWSIGARHPDLFAGLVTMSGRGDYYFWHGVDRERLPAYKRRLIDADFAAPKAARLARANIFSAHGEWDDLVPVGEGRFIASAIRAVNPNLIYEELPQAGHNIFEEAFHTARMWKWLRSCRRPAKTIPPMRDPVSVKTAFLSPFLYVFAGRLTDPVERRKFEDAAADWQRFAKAPPRIALERAVTTNMLASCNLFLFGEPESSGLIRSVLRTSPVAITRDSYQVGDRHFPRRGNGLFVVRPNPWNPERLAVVQSGLPWGAGLPENHKYDFLPAYIVYNGLFDEDGSNHALAAGFFSDDWRLAE